MKNITMHLAQFFSTGLVSRLGKALSTMASRFCFDLRNSTTVIIVTVQMTPNGSTNCTINILITNTRNETPTIPLRQIM